MPASAPRWPFSHRRSCSNIATPARSLASIDTSTDCAACRQHPAEELYPVTLRTNGGEVTTRIGLCADCLHRRLRLRRTYGLLLLGVFWLPALIYCYAVYQNDALDPYWQFASAAPAILIALYLSAFFYDWVLNAFRDSGLRRTGENWAQKLARQAETEE